MALKGKGICKAIVVVLPNIMITKDFLSLELGRVDVILGMVWLCNMGYMEVNWSTLTMTFVSRDRKVTLKGDPTLTTKEVTLKTLTDTWEEEDCGLLIEFQHLGVGEGAELEKEQMSTDEVPIMIQGVLDEFKESFAKPSSLPPKQAVDHRINTKADAVPVNVRPYKYSHTQKDEIEKLVNKMLSVGIIRPGRSPYSSPILLVKKKDGGWRFCVDYRRLNQATISDKFPLPVIEEFIDELHGSVIFLKLDLRSGYHQIRMEEVDIEKMTF